MHKKIVASIILATLLICPGLVFAFGLGEIEIHSALNQPMDAEIELVGFNASEIDEVKVSLASQQMFERVGVPRPFILTRLKFTPAMSAGKPIIRVTSTEAIREPFLTFLIDVRWSKGKLLREYTVLLDPPVFGDQAKAAIQAPKVTKTPAPKPKAKPIAKTTPKPKTTSTPKVASPNVAQKTKPRPVSRPPTPVKKTKESIPVKRGDTLWSIAEPFAKKHGVSVNQMMLAIQEANPQGFDQANINNLKSGVVLRIPANGLDRYSSRQALAEVQRQWQVWQQGRKLSESTDNVVNVDSGDEKPVSESSDPAATKPEPAKTDSSKLSILGDDDVSEGKSGDDAKATLQDLRKQVNLLKESSESKGQENTELKDRIASLESMIKKQENIISLQNEQLAQLQNTISANTQTGDSSPEVDAATQEPVLAEEQAVAPEAAVEAPNQAVTEISKAHVEPLPDFSDPIPEEFLNAETPEQAEPESLIAEAEVSEEVEQPVMEKPAEVAAPSMFDSIMATLQDQSRNMLYAGGALLVALLGWIGIRRRGNKEAEVTARGLDTPVFEEEPSVDEMLDETVIATPDSVDQALDDLEEVESEMTSLDEDESESSDSDDVLAEADVYVSYGLYQQAEELLKEGLAKDPDNQQYQLKLAEIFYSDKRADEFAQQVEAMEPNFNKNSAEWTRVVSMGAALIPDHALFANAESAAPVANQAEENSLATDFDMESDEEIESFSESVDDNSLDFTFGDEEEVSQTDSGTVIEEAENLVSKETPEETNDLAFDDELEESSTAMLEASDLDFSDDQTQAFAAEGDDLLDTPQASEDKQETSDGETEVFLDFDQDALESELNTPATHDSATEMLEQPEASDSIDLDDAINLDEDLETASMESVESALEDSVDNDLDDMLEGEGSETAMFDSSLFDVGDEANEERVDEDTVSLEQVQENLTAELETLSFDSDDIDPDKIEEESLPTLQTSELGKPNMDEIDDLDDNLAASETGTFEADAFADKVTEQFDVGNLDSSMTDLGEFGDDADLETPSVIEEVGTKLDLAKAFVDMGDEDAAKETLTEVIEQGDITQIQEAKDLLDKLN